MASGKEINANTYPNWAVQGLGGCVNILESVDDKQHQLSDEQRAKLRQLLVRLGKLALRWGIQTEGNK